MIFIYFHRVFIGKPPNIVSWPECRPEFPDDADDGDDDDDDDDDDDVPTTLPSGQSPSP